MSRSRGRRRVVWALLLLVAAAGCGHAPEAGAWLGRVEQAHQVADRALAHDDLDGARAALRALLEAPPAAGVAPADRRAVLQDACFRLAVVELRAGHPGAAAAIADRGLALERADDLFSANLLVARGHAREALGAEAPAAADYHAALLINEALLERALGAGR